MTRNQIPWLSIIIPTLAIAFAYGVMVYFIVGMATGRP